MNTRGGRERRGERREHQEKGKQEDKSEIRVHLHYLFKLLPPSFISSTLAVPPSPHQRRRDREGNQIHTSRYNGPIQYQSLCVVLRGGLDESMIPPLTPHTCISPGFFSIYDFRHNTNSSSYNWPSFHGEMIDKQLRGNVRQFSLFYPGPANYSGAHRPAAAVCSTTKNAHVLSGC